MIITGYKFSTQEQALQVVNQLNSYWGFPETEGSTRFDMSMFQNWGGGYWVSENSEWYEPVLGEPYEFEIPEPKF